MKETNIISVIVVILSIIAVGLVIINKPADSVNLDEVYDRIDVLTVQLTENRNAISLISNGSNIPLLIQRINRLESADTIINRDISSLEDDLDDLDNDSDDVDDINDCLYDSTTFEAFRECIRAS